MFLTRCACNFTWSSTSTGLKEGDMASTTRIRADHEVTWTRSITTWSKLIPFCAALVTWPKCRFSDGPFPVSGWRDILIIAWLRSQSHPKSSRGHWILSKEKTRQVLCFFFLIGWSLDIRSMWKIKCLLSMHFLLFNLIVRFSISGAFVHYKNKSSYKYRKEIWIFGLFFLWKMYSIFPSSCV